MKKQFFITITVVGLLSSVGCKSGQETTQGKGDRNRQGGQPSATELIKEMDANDDGKLSKEEVKGPLANDFSKIDSDDDGYLTKEELENAPKPESQGAQGGRPQGGRN